MSQLAIAAVRPRDATARSHDQGAWPQVGMVLGFDGNRLRPADWYGSPHWDADGSAVLVAPRYALTIRHAAPAEVGPDKRFPLDRHAVFFPSVGLVRVTGGEIMERERDRLLLLELAQPVDLPPIPTSPTKLTAVEHPLAVGFGDWTTAAGETYPRGVQRTVPPVLGGCTHDLCWDAAGGSFTAGVNNSGGPVIDRRADGSRVAGIMRRVREDIPGKVGQVVAATTISRNRAGWLYRRVYRIHGRVGRPLLPPPVLWRELELVGPDLVGPIPVPAGTHLVCATLSAARRWVGDLLLQMRLLPGAPDELPGGGHDRILAHLARDPLSVGEILTRSLAIGQASAISVAIAPVSPLPGLVRAQLCLRFLDARGVMLPAG